MISLKSDLENIPKIDRKIGPNLFEVAFKFFYSSTNSLNLFEFSHFINNYSHKIPREASDTERSYPFSNENSDFFLS